MIFEELLYAFRADLELEFMKRGAEQSQLKLNDKQIKLIFSKIISDLQKEFKMILSSQTISSINGEQAYALTRDFMTLHSVYYGAKKLTLTTLENVYNKTSGRSTPQIFAIKVVGGYPYIILYPAPDRTGTDIIVKSYNDMKLFSINDGADPKSVGATDDLYMNIPTMYDAAVLVGMMAEIFDDKTPKYEKEKLRLRGLRFNEMKIEYDMTGVNDDFPKITTNYNSSADATPSIVPGDPIAP